MKRGIILIACIFFFLSCVSAEDQGFDVDKPIIYATVDYGETTSLSFTLLNYGDSGEFLLTPTYSHPFFDLSTRSFFVEKDGSSPIDLTLGSSTLVPGVYVGSISVIKDEFTMEIPVVLEVQRGPLLFDATIRELPYYSELSTGQPFSPQVILYNLRAFDSTVSVDASIYSLEGKVVSHISQVFDVKNTLETSLSLPIPADLPDGAYILGLDLIAGSSHATATTSLRVGSPSLSPSMPVQNKSFFYSLIIIAFLLISFLLLNYLWHRHLISSTRYWDEQIKQAHGDKDVYKTSHRLTHQLSLLTEAYSKGYIAKETYLATKTRIEKARRALKKRL